MRQSINFIETLNLWCKICTLIYFEMSEYSGKRRRHRHDSSPSSRSPSPKRLKYDHYDSKEYHSSSRYHERSSRRDDDYSKPERKYGREESPSRYSSKDRHRSSSHREDTSTVSSNKDDYKHKAERRERKERKKEKKERKKEKKEKKKRIKALKKQAKQMLQERNEPIRGKPPKLLLSVEENYYSHNKEFRHWLLKTNKKTWDELSNTEAREQFLQFTEIWNEGGLPGLFTFFSPVKCS